MAGWPLRWRRKARPDRCQCARQKNAQPQKADEKAAIHSTVTGLWIAAFGFLVLVRECIRRFEQEHGPIEGNVQPDENVKPGRRG